ncbi:MAG: hypothetical protein K2X87_00565 [Gemmataceae bacterium]|nr:hypothetical protein [Gemmataceae bacterium]
MARNRQHFRDLADVRVAEAGALIAAGRWDGAYYLAGYAIELALKACILARIDLGEKLFEDKDFAKDCYTHNFRTLRRLADLDKEWVIDAPDGSVLATNWDKVKEWSEQKRYARNSKADAQALYEAITDPAHGVLTWIKRYW